MADFTYEALNQAGKKVTGTVQADSEDMARSMVASQGLIPAKISQKGGGAFSLAELQLKMAKVKVPDLILVTKQIRTMFNAGISIITLLEILEDQTENPKLKAVVGNISSDIREGSTLYNAFRKHPSVFSPLYCAMLRAGEISGTLAEVMDRLIYIIEHDYKVRKQIKSAMMYPIIVVVLLFAAFIFLLTFVIPKFVTMFASSGVELPLPTRICMIMYDGLMAYWPYMIGGVVLGAGGLIYALRTYKGRLTRDRLLLRMPLFGPVVRKGAMARFSSIFSILQSSGVSVLDSVEILAETIGNDALALEFKKLKSQLEEGRGLAGPMRKSTVFTPMVVNMVAIGEETGNLDEMMQEMANHYDYEVEHAINRMTELIGPILMVALAGVVGFFALAIYLPLIDVIKTMK